MAEERGRPRRVRLPERLDESVLRMLVLRTFGQSRWTQDSPVVPDVWIAYIRAIETQVRRRLGGDDDADATVDLLLTPWTGTTPAEIASELREALDPALRGRAEIAPSESRVVARLSFRSLVREAIPMTGWWRRATRPSRGLRGSGAAFAEWTVEACGPTAVVPGADNGRLRYATLVGFVNLLAEAKGPQDLKEADRIARRLGPPDDPNDPSLDKSEAYSGIGPADLRSLLESYTRICGEVEAAAAEETERGGGIWLINLNRPSYRALFDSRKTIKADAAQRVFDTVATGIVFAVIDDGIDARHPAFLDRRGDGMKTLTEGADEALPDTELLRLSRIGATYDFSILRQLLAACSVPEDMRSGLDPRIVAIFEDPDPDPDRRKASAHLCEGAESRRDLDWSIVAPLIRIRHDDAYLPPAGDHGTHVAGIMAADLPKPIDLDRALTGICPGMGLYDLRVFGRDGSCAEFAILCALEFVGWLNRDRANPVIHGVNLSLALMHDVDSFACGRTPVCDVCNGLVGSGTVVVTAAGNTGFDQSAGKRSLGSGYRAVSITDPGNAEAVITVGSTHRRDPHAYGVSYFSSRGPTGDGRKKPDILAPGEKITSTIRAGRTQVKDGTSMAAPHVSAAAAMLMSRYPELIGQPGTIKATLMRTAVDLGREPQFQGAGLVDVLRALQSV